MAKVNAINNQTGDLTIDPGASGDSFIQFDINATGEFRIGVDDTDDSFRISQGSALGTNDTFIVTAVGEITKPLQPAFFAYRTGTSANVTGNGTTFTLQFDTEVYDVGGDYDTTTYTFTAPVTGRYRLIGNPWISQVNLAAFDTQFVQLVTSNRTYKGVVCDSNARTADPAVSGQSSNPLGVLADMDASDTCTLTMTVGGHLLTVDVGNVGVGDMRGFFSGTLIC